MSSAVPVVVIDRDGLKGIVEEPRQLKAAKGSEVHIRMEDGAKITVPVELLRLQDDRTYYLPLSLAEGASADLPDTRIIVLPVVAEELSVQKRQVQTGGVRVTKQVHEREEVVDEPGFEEEVSVERVPVERVLEAPATVRTEGDTLIVPVMEETLVIQKRLVLKEELRITKRRREVRAPEHVTLRREEVNVERLPGE
jgi:uncharacterized protein (TIGR02271 family)